MIRIRDYLAAPTGDGRTRRALFFSLTVAAYTAVAVSLIHLFVDAGQTPLEFAIHLTLITATYTLCLTVAWLFFDALLRKTLPGLRNTVAFLWLVSSSGFALGINLLSEAIASLEPDIRDTLAHDTGGWLLRLLPVWFVVTAVLVQTERSRYFDARLVDLQEARKDHGGDPLPYQNDEEKTITLVSGDQHQLLCSDSIRYIEAAENYCSYHLAGDNSRPPLLIRNTLKNAISELPASQFVQLHRSYVVNLQCVESISRKRRHYLAVMTGDQTMLPVARGRLDAVIQRWQRFLQSTDS